MLSTLIKKWRGERPSIFILSGAGLSVESGIPTYRGAGSDAKNDSPSLSKGYMRSIPEKVFFQCPLTRMASRTAGYTSHHHAPLSKVL